MLQWAVQSKKLYYNGVTHEEAKTSNRLGVHSESSASFKRASFNDTNQTSANEEE